MCARWYESRLDRERVARSDGFDRLASLCHDLRQYAAAGLLLTDKWAGDKELPAKVLDRLAHANEQFRCIADLISAELEDDDRPLSHIDVAELIDQCVRVSSVAHDVPVDTLAVDRPFLYGDAVLLRRALNNILDNACRAASGMGQVYVRLAERDGRARIEIEDEGSGFGQIPPGNGRGLPLVRAAVSAHRGRLDIADAPRGGTLVTVELPLSPEGLVGS